MEVKRTMENAFLLSLTLSGVKNIEKDVSLSFYDSTKPAKIDPSSHIKAIYGSNGAGKTAIIVGTRILRNIIANPDYLASSVSSLDPLLNKSTNSFHFKVVFAIYSSSSLKVRDVYSYEISITKENGVFLIKRESIGRCIDNTIKGKFKDLIWSEGGSLFFGPTPIQEEVAVAESIRNTISRSSFVQLFVKNVIELYPKMMSSFNSLVPMIDTLQFFTSLDSYVETCDLPSFCNYEDLADENSAFRKAIYLIHSHNLKISPEMDYIKEKDIAGYEKKVENLTHYVKLFKPDLRSIDIVKTLMSEDEEGKTFACRKLFNYGKYTVNSEYESTGIKKMINLYEILQESVYGKIVFIDEMDANISGVFLDKLIEFLSQYAKGQICFTTHSLSPMRILKNKKHSLDFLNDSQEVYSWKKGGGKNPSLLYPEGLIPGSPFNVEAFNFLNVFDLPEGN